jgi:hypothetical protein
MAFLDANFPDVHSHDVAYTARVGGGEGPALKTAYLTGKGTPKNFSTRRGAKKSRRKQAVSPVKVALWYDPKVKPIEAKYEWPFQAPDVRSLDPSTPCFKTQNEAYKSKFKPHVVAAEKLEIKTLESMGYAREVEKSQVTKGAKILRGRWVYAWKKNKDGKITHLKARWTLRGDFQTHGVDYWETFSSTMTLKTFRTVLALVNLNPAWTFEHIDISSAFINSPLDVKVFAYQPSGHERSKLILLVLKAIYGLHQSGRCFQQLLSAILETVGCRPLKCDPAVYFRREKDAWIIIPSYVDDLFIAANVPGQALKNQVIKAITAKLKVTFEGDVQWALKTRIHRDVKRGIVKICQASYVGEVLVRYQFENASGKDTPLDPNLKMTPPSEVTDLEAKKFMAYPIRELIGCLSWLSQVSRPDIQAAVHLASMCQHRPSQKLWDMLTRILQYLKKFPRLGLVYQRPTWDEGSFLIEAWIDVSFSPDSNFWRGRSIIGGAVKVYNALTTWFTQRSNRKPSSSSEAECNALTEMGKENRWQRDLQILLGIFVVDEPSMVWEDNTAAITLSGSNTYHKRSKHFGLDWWATKEWVERGEMYISYVNTTEQLADFFTKGLYAPQFVHLRQGLMGSDEIQKHFDDATTAKEDGLVIEPTR